MKIISTPEELDELGKQELRRIRANLGCNVCPYCGESRNTFDHTFPKDGKLHGVSRGIVSSKHVSGKFFHRDELSEDKRIRFYVPGRTIHTDLWECFDCGSHWESDPW